MCFDFLYNFRLKDFILSTEGNMIKNVYWSSCDVPVILARLQRNLNFLDGFSKNARLSDVMKLRPVGAELFLADGHI